MVHFTCDLCGKDLTASGVPRYVVRMEVCAGFDPNQIREDDLEDDPMVAVSDLIHQSHQGGDSDPAAESPRGFRFDLCPKCRARFVEDPLGREVTRSFDFSQN